jgi:hypothetical protein
MKNLKQIPINIWDDFHDDEYVPEGKIQETFAYVEDYDIPDNNHKEILQIMLDYIKLNITLKDVELDLIFYDSKNGDDEETVKKCIEVYGEKFFYKRYEIKFKYLTHEQLDMLVKELNKANLIYNDIPFYIYSES